MKKNLFITLLILINTLSFAQVQWQDNGIPVRQGENIEWNQASVACEDGTFVSVWSDTRDGIRGVYAQKVDINGNLLWDENGLAVSNESNRQEYPVIIESGSGDVIIAWVDFRNDYSGDVYAQKISSEGIIQWAEEGIPLCLSEDFQGSLNIVSDDNDGAFVIWQDGRNMGGTDIFGIHIDTNGNIVSGWATDGNPIVNANGNQYQHTFWEDGSNGAIVAWHDDRDTYDPNIYMQRIASNGDLLWDENGNLLTGAVGPQETPKIAPDGTGNFIFTWRDRGTDSFGDIKAQRVDLNGNLLWANEVDVYVGEGIQRNTRITNASDNGAIIVWEDGRNEASENYKDLYAQKLDINGNLQWDPSGIEIAQAMYDQINPRINSDANGGAWIIWDDSRVSNHPHEDIYIQHVASNGTFELPINGFDVCSADGWQFSPLVKLSEDRIFCVWGDRRTDSTELYVQLLDTYGNTILEEDGEEIVTGLSGSVIDYQMLQNADNPIIIWSERRNNNNYRIFLQILNGDGSNVFVENGIPITANANFYLYDFEAVYGENSATIALIWAENRLGYQQIFAQGIDTEGNLLWADSTGICLTPVDFESIKPKISLIDNFGTDEYYIGWEDYTDFMDSRITGQKIVNGNLEWGTEGKVIADRNYNDELTEVIENYYIWQSVGYNNQNIFCLMVDENGDPAPGWPEDGLEVCVEDGTQNKARGIITPQGLLVLWEDYRNGDVDIYGQLITPDGNIHWQENGLPLVTQENDQDYFKFIYDNGLYIVWQDSRSSYYPDIYLQKFDLDGNELWQEGGILVAETSDNGYYYPDLVKVGSKIIIVWGNYNDYGGLDICSQLMSDDGELLWQLQGKTICNEIMDQRKPVIVSNGNDDAYISWIDHRSTIMGNEGLVAIPGIYAQKLHLEPTYVDEELVKPIEILSNYPNPFNPETTIYFETTNLHELAQIEIYNIKGQKIRTINCHTEPVEVGNGSNTYSVTWNGADQNNQPVASGIYFYQLNVDDEVIASKKCLLLK